MGVEVGGVDRRGVPFDQRRERQIDVVVGRVDLLEQRVQAESLVLQGVDQFVGEGPFLQAAQCAVVAADEDHLVPIGQVEADDADGRGVELLGEQGNPLGRQAERSQGAGVARELACFRVGAQRIDQAQAQPPAVDVDRIDVGHERLAAPVGDLPPDPRQVVGLGRRDDPAPDEQPGHQHRRQRRGRGATSAGSDSDHPTLHRSAPAFRSGARTARPVRVDRSGRGGLRAGAYRSSKVVIVASARSASGAST